MGPARTFSEGFRAMRYNAAHAGNKASPAIAQNGIFLRDLAAATYGGSATTGFGAGASAAFAGVAGVATAGVDDGALSPEASPDASARRALERFRRCSGISVTALYLSGRPWKKSSESGSAL